MILEATRPSVFLNRYGTKLRVVFVRSSGVKLAENQAETETEQARCIQRN